MSEGPRFRYAPTPSRELHVGNGLSALIGWASARAAGGTFILRIEDIDRQRCRPEFEETCLRDLKWLGIDWDEGPDVGGDRGPYRQSERFGRYDDALRELVEAGTVYPCVCSRADIARHVQAPHSHEGQEVPYGGTCRSREPAQGLVGDRGGYRLQLDALQDGPVVAWEDAFLGHLEEDVSRTCGDFLLGRWGRPTYQLASVVDDRDMGITHVVRGRDLAGSSARQSLLHRALGYSPPYFAHHPLLLDEAGSKLSKRDMSLSMSMFRRSGASPNDLIARMMQTIGALEEGVEAVTAAECVVLLSSRANWNDGIWRS